MGYKTISTDNSSWTGTASADYVYINYADKVRVNTAGGNDSIYNYWGWYDTIDAGDGNDTINLYYGNYASINAGDGNDRVSLNGASSGVITIKGGKGNDTVYGSGNKTLHQYANGDGNDVIYNWSENDTISITGASGYSRSTVGSDVVLEVGNGKITLKGAKGKTVNVKFASGVIFNNILSNHVVNGTANVEKIENTGNHVTINAGAGDDSVLNTFSNGGANGDFISLGGDAVNVTVNGGTGSDVIYGDKAAQLFQYTAGEGYDLIYNWSANDTLQITGGTYTRSTVGNSVILKTNNGSVELLNAKGLTVNVKGTLAGGSNGNSIINNTASNRIISGTAYADTIKNSGSRVTINAYGGNDSIYSNGDNVKIYAGDGNDTIDNGCANVTIDTGAGNDRINNYSTGSNNKTSISTGAGNDTIDNCRGNTTINMGDGNDFMWNEFATRSAVFLGAGNDSIISYSDNATISGDSGNDTIVSYYGKNTSISGGAGADVVSLGANSTNVTINGGKDNDTIYGDSAAQLFQYANGDGNDVIYNWSANDTISITGGNYTRSIVGSDVVLKVGSGAVTLKGAKNLTVNVKGTQTTSTTPTTSTNKVSIPSGAFTYGGHSYYIFYGLNSWEQAKSYCESRGGHLAVINSSGENTALFNYMKRTGYDSAYFGLSDVAKEGTWSWVNGERVSYTNWASGEPNGGSYENYGMFYYKYSNGKWNDGNFAAGSTFYSGGQKIVDTNAFICEWDTVTSSNVQQNVGVNVNNTVSNKIINGTSYADTITNSGQKVTINASAGNDKISNNHGNNSSIVAGAGNDSVYCICDYVTVYGGAGSDTISNGVWRSKIFGDADNDFINLTRYWYNTLDGGDGNDTIYAGGSEHSVNGGAGADKISLSGSDLTVKGGTGNDTLYFGGSKNIIQYASGDGNDLIYNWSANDTISITGASYIRSTVGSDVVLKVGTGAVTLKDAKNSTVNVKGTLASGGNSTTPAPQNSGNVIYGTNGHDSIKNTVAGKVIYAYDGNDTVRNSANNVYISGGAGNDSIESYSYAANVTVNGDDGNDNIKVSGANAKIYCGNGNDSVDVVRGDNDYIEGGAGDDTLDVWSGKNLSLKGGTGNDAIDISSNNSSCVIAYNSGDGSDTVWGFDGNDTLKVYGSYTRSTVGNDVVVKVGSGSITLKNAKGQTLNISNLTTSADLASDDWISADDNNFVTNDTRLDSIVEVSASDYSVGNLDSPSAALTAKNLFVAFTGKK